MTVNRHVTRFRPLHDPRKGNQNIFSKRPSTSKTAFKTVITAALILLFMTGCANRTLVPAGAEPSAALSSGAVYGFAWRSTTARNPGYIYGATVNFQGPARSDGTRRVTSTTSQRISVVAGRTPRLVRITSSTFFAAWVEGDSVYGRYVGAPSMRPLFPADPPLRLNPGESGGFLGFDIAHSASENRVLLVTGRSGGNAYLYEIRRTASGSPPFTSTRVATLTPLRGRPDDPRIAVGDPGGRVVILITLASGAYHIVRPGEAGLRGALDPATGMGAVSDHSCVYDPGNRRFLEVLGSRAAGGRLYSAIIYPEGSHGRNTPITLPAFSPAAPATISVMDGRDTLRTRFSVMNAGIYFEDVAPTGRRSGSVFSLVYSEYHEEQAVTERILPGDAPPPPIFVRSTRSYYQNFYTLGLDVLGQVTGSRIVRGPTGRRSDARRVEAALSPEAEIRHAIIIGSDGAQHVEWYPPP